jgi:hypothetical protein
MSPGFREEDKITTGDDHQVRVGLDLGQHLQAMQPWQAKGQNDQPGMGRAGVLASPAEEPQGQRPLCGGFPGFPACGNVFPQTFRTWPPTCS